jgi:hypothetical protein
VHHSANTLEDDHVARSGVLSTCQSVRALLTDRATVVLPELLRWLGFLVVSVWLSWPLAKHFSYRIAGLHGDPFQTLWSWRWLYDALVELRNPFFTDRAYYPHGGPMVFQTFDIPTAILTLPLWHVLPPVAIYNTGILFAFWLTAYGMYLLAFELTRDRLTAFCAGVLFTACPYHVAHATASQHLASMGWLPLYFLYLHRILAAQSRTRDGLLAGLFLALASLASWYHLLFAMVGSFVLILHAALRSPKDIFAKAFIARALALGAAYMVCAGPLLIAIFLSKSQQTIAGAHDPRTYSGDLYEFFFPNEVQAWSKRWGGHFVKWTGNSAENAMYAGYSVVLVGLLALFVRDRRARGWLVVALLGAVLALGPVLQVDGVMGTRALPYDWLEHAFPPLAFMGVPVRFSYLLYLGLIVAWAIAVARLRQLARKTAERRGLAPNRWLSVGCALVPLALGLYEYRPGPFETTEAIVHPPMLEWGRDRSTYAVLDLSDMGSMQWHATLHRKPTTWGYLSRVPAWLDDWYEGLPVVHALQHPTPLPLTRVFERVDDKLDFDWDNEAPSPRLHRTFYHAQWTGRLLVPRPGVWTFYLSSDDASSLKLDRSQLLDNRDNHPMQTVEASRELGEGPHRIRVVYDQARGGAGIKLEWEGPDQPRQVVPQAAYLSERGQPGLSAVYSQGGESCELDPAAGRAALRALAVRYVITGEDDRVCLQDSFDIPEIYHDRGIRIWQVPRAD